MRAGRVVTKADRERARALIARVDARIQSGLDRLEPLTPMPWSNPGCGIARDLEANRRELGHQLRSPK